MRRPPALGCCRATLAPCPGRCGRGAGLALALLALLLLLLATQRRLGLELSRYRGAGRVAGLGWGLRGCPLAPGGGSSEPFLPWGMINPESSSVCLPSPRVPGCSSRPWLGPCPAAGSKPGSCFLLCNTGVDGEGGC